MFVLKQREGGANGAVLEGLDNMVDPGVWVWGEEAWGCGPGDHVGYGDGKVEG